MRRAIILASLIFLNSCAAMQIPERGPTAVLTFGIYHAFPEVLSAVYEKRTLNLLRQSADAINQEIFGWPAFEFKAVFTEKWPIDEVSIYQDKEIIFALDADEMLKLVEKRLKPEADIYLFITNSPIAAKNADGKMEISGGITKKLRDKKIAIGNFPRPWHSQDIHFVLHELGHFLGVGHSEEALCGEIPFVMCLDWNEKAREGQIVFDEAFIKAFQKLYFSRANQAPPQ